MKDYQKLLHCVGAYKAETATQEYSCHKTTLPVHACMCNLPVPQRVPGVKGLAMCHVKVSTKCFKQEPRTRRINEPGRHWSAFLVAFCHGDFFSPGHICFGITCSWGAFNMFFSCFLHLWAPSLFFLSRSTLRAPLPNNKAVSC